MPKDFNKPNNPNEIPENTISETKDIKIISQSKKTQQIDAKIYAEKETELFINLAFFPAWQIYIDGKKSEYSYFNRGLLVKIPRGEHAINIKFAQTPIEKLGNILSLAGVFVLIIGIIISQRKHIYEQKIA
jgi:hypothetical protein